MYPTTNTPLLEYDVIRRKRTLSIFNIDVKYHISFILSFLSLRLAEFAIKGNLSQLYVYSGIITADCTRCESQYRCEIVALRDSGSRHYVLLTTTILAEITGLVGTARKDSDTPSIT